MSLFEHWQALHAERLEEAVSALSRLPGVAGLVLGGSVARGEHWPLSDIDIIPIWEPGRIDDAAMAVEQARLVDWWAASGRAQTLDVSWIRFDTAEVRRALDSEPAQAASLMSEPRWLHGIDKIYGGRGLADPQGLAEAFAAWATDARFEPEVRGARLQIALQAAERAAQAAQVAHREHDPAGATLAVRTGAREARLALLEHWGERLGSMGREWTLFERIAARHGGSNWSAPLAALAGADLESTAARAALVPIWLAERIRLAFEARCLTGEQVSDAESRRDQMAAFAVHVSRRRGPPWPDWLGVPAPELEDHLELLAALLPRIRHTCSGR